MYAIVDIAGQQIKVKKDQQVFVNRLEGAEGDKVQFDKVLLIDNEGKVVVGSPMIDGAAVSAKIVAHLKGDKVLVFKKKRRKGYKKLNGHRQYLSKVVIEEITAQGAIKAAPKATQKAEQKPTAEAPVENAPVQDAPKQESAGKQAAPNKVAAKKTAAKKAAAKKVAKDDKQD